MKRLSICLALLTAAGIIHAQNTDGFTNPLLPSGADPYSCYKDGYYYYMNTSRNTLQVRKTKSITQLADAAPVTIWTPPPGTAYSRDIWAPEILFIRGKWYVYFAADDGDNAHHRIYVLENTSPDSQKGAWEFKGKVADPSDKWAIDSDVLEYKGQLYMVWAGWQGDGNGEQDIYIAKMENPWTIAGSRVRISSPVYDWELHGDLHDAINPPHVSVNEGPQFLQHRDRLFIVYSASGCWTDYYALGMLSFAGGDNLLDPAAWKKSPRPVFKQSPENGVFAPGHNSFFKSPDGTEDWILYHANSAPGQGCGGQRSPRAQPFFWNQDGTPYFGEPVKAGVVLPVPSGTKQ